MLCGLFYKRILKKQLIFNPVKSFGLISSSNSFRSMYNLSNKDIKLDTETVKLLEKLSLINFETDKYIPTVEEAINFVDSINSVNTDNVEPLISLLENENLKLRDDVVNDGNCLNDILKNAALVEESYFIAPPGNIPINFNSNEK